MRIAAEPAPGVRPILHLKQFHATNDHYGLSPLEAAASAIDLHNTAAQWNKALLDNAARPSGALVYTARDGNMTAEQYERLKSELENGFQGSANAGRPSRGSAQETSCSKAASTGNPCRSHRKIWTSSKPATSPPARSPSRSGCRRCCSA